MTYLKDNQIAELRNRITVPFGPLGEFVYLRTYSPYDYNERKREDFFQTTQRWVNYNLSLDKVSSPEFLQREADALAEHSLNLGLFPSGRTMWVGGRSPSYEVPQSNFNCAFRVIDDLAAFTDIMELSMVGSGVGFSVERKYLQEVPELQAVKITCQPYQPWPAHQRTDFTSTGYVTEEDETLTASIVVGDSKAGWVSALGQVLRLCRKGSNVSEIKINFDSVRPEGEPLKRFGGRASGPVPLYALFAMIERIACEQGTRTYRPETVEMVSKTGQTLPELKGGWTSIQALDLANMIGHVVVVGGVRRTAEIALGDSDDTHFQYAKSNLYDVETNKSIMEWRYCSNNSQMFYKKPGIDEIRARLDLIRNNGEPGFINAEEAQRRRPNFKGVNPCAEILLDDKGVCNLSTVNLMAYVSVESGYAYLDKERLFEAFRLATRIGVRQTCVDLTLPGWDDTQKRDRLVGVSMTGWMDMLEQLGRLTDTQWQAYLLTELRAEVAEQTATYSQLMGIPTPLLATTVKPEGTLSKLPTVSSGLTPSIAPYYLRRVRVDAKDPVAIVAREQGIPVEPLYKNGTETLETATTWVLEFPVHSSATKTTYEYGAVQLLEQYKMFMTNYVDHNASNTIYVRDEEWEDVAQWLDKNWNHFVGISFMRYFDARTAPFPQMPEEIISKEEFERRIATMPVAFDKERLMELDRITNYDDILTYDEACATGACPIR